MIERSLSSYRQLRAAGMGETDALRAVRTLALFDELKDAGFVRLNVQPDPDHDGMWGVLGQYRVDPSDEDEWESASVLELGGCRNDVADPYKNWPVIDLMAQALDEFLKETTALRLTYAEQPDED